MQLTKSTQSMSDWQKASSSAQLPESAQAMQPETESPQKPVLSHPPVSWHDPLTQVVPELQLTSQPPQCCELDWVFTHAPLQNVSPAAHGSWQAPPAQVSPDPHGMSHPPQCSGLVWVSTHWLPHWFRLPGHSATHPPLTHVVLRGHVT
jgi:hypothetical protein